jgi:hypothetical protein
LRALSLLIAAGASTLGLFAVFGGIRVGPRPWDLVVMTGAGTAAVAAVALWIAVARGKAMIGRSRAWLWGGIVIAPLGYLAWKVASTAPFAEMSADWPDRPGWRCFRLSLIFAAPPLAALLYLRRRSDPVHPRTMGAAIGAAMGACAAVLVDLFCPVAYLPHLLLGHVLPTLLLVALGASVGGRWLRM